MNDCALGLLERHIDDTYGDGVVTKRDYPDGPLVVRVMDGDGEDDTVWVDPDGSVLFWARLVPVGLLWQVVRLVMEWVEGEGNA